MGLRVFKSWNLTGLHREWFILGYRIRVYWALFDYIVGTVDGYCAV